MLDGQVFGPDGNVIGSVKGTVQATAPVASAPNDGGFGSVPQLLLAGSSGTGTIPRLVPVYMYGLEKT